MPDQYDPNAVNYGLFDDNLLWQALQSNKQPQSSSPAAPGMPGSMGASPGPATLDPKTGQYGADPRFPGGITPKGFPSFWGPNSMDRTADPRYPGGKTPPGQPSFWGPPPEPWMIAQPGRPGVIPGSEAYPGRALGPASMNKMQGGMAAPFGSSPSQPVPGPSLAMNNNPNALTGYQTPGFGMTPTGGNINPTYAGRPSLQGWGPTGQPQNYGLGGEIVQGMADPELNKNPGSVPLDTNYAFNKAETPTKNPLGVGDSETQKLPSANMYAYNGASDLYGMYGNNINNEHIQPSQPQIGQTHANSFEAIGVQPTYSQIPSGPQQTQLAHGIYSIAPKADPSIVNSIVQNKNVLDEAGINTPARLAAFVSQTAHESGGFRAMTEAPSQYASSQSLYKGRGIIQLTGRANYEQYGKQLGLPLVQHPELAAEPANSVRIAAAYWKNHNLNQYADKGDVVGLTKAINGGLNGLSSRMSYYNKAQQAFGASSQGQGQAAPAQAANAQVKAATANQGGKQKGNTTGDGMSSSGDSSGGSSGGGV